MTIHVATVHWRTAEWIDLQLAYLRRNLRDDYKVWACLEGIDNHHAERFDVVIPAEGGHSGKLNLLASHICDEAEPSDVLMFLDGDAFPIGDVKRFASTALSDVPLVAIRRDENMGDPQPHPSFCMTSVETWRAVRGDWLSGFGWSRPDGSRVTDVGGNLLYLLERAGIAWKPLLRTHQLDEHPIWFGVYGSLVYHHGAGFRPAISRWDEQGRPGIVPPQALRAPVVGRALGHLDRRRQERWAAKRSGRVEDLSRDVMDRIEDPRVFDDLLKGKIGRTLAPPADFTPPSN